MHLRSLLAPFLLSALAAPAAAQVGSAVGPPVAPEGAPIVISFSNDTSGSLVTGICPYQVFDESGDLVFTPSCFAIAVFVAPGGTFSTTWEQELDTGGQAPPGIYRIDVDVPEIGIVSHEIEISTEVEAAIASIGVPKVGQERNLQFAAPSYPDQIYLLAASTAATPGIPTCAGTMPLDLSPVLTISLNPSNGVFLNFFGQLGDAGLTTDPAIAVPDDPSFAGLNLTLAGAVLDLRAAGCPITAIGEPFPLTTK